MKRYIVVLFAALLAATAATVAPGSKISPALATGNPVILAVGDMACDQSDVDFKQGDGTSRACAQKRVSNRMLADNSGYTAVLGLGDYQYDCGDLADWQVSYNPTYGRLDSLMDPIAGNHEYKTGTDSYGKPCPTTNTTAQGYFTHFGASSHQGTNGHYSFSIGSWHFIALNANCSNKNVGGCAATSAQTTWLKNDLASVNPAAQPCIAAFWHQPLWTGHGKRNSLVYQPWWKVLYAAHADVVLNGHVHNYQRFAALDPTGKVDSANGITEYIVGTGGEDLMTRTTLQPHATGFASTFGYLRMTLLAKGWSAQFVNASGAVLDSSSGTCHV